MNIHTESYADYELNKIDNFQNVKVKIRDTDGDETHWISITPETLEKIRHVLRNAPETRW